MFFLLLCTIVVLVLSRILLLHFSSSKCLFIPQISICITSPAVVFPYHSEEQLTIVRLLGIPSKLSPYLYPMFKWTPCTYLFKCVCLLLPQYIIKSLFWGPHLVFVSLRPTTVDGTQWGLNKYLLNDYCTTHDPNFLAILFTSIEISYLS